MKLWIIGILLLAAVCLAYEENEESEEIEEGTSDVPREGNLNFSDFPSADVFDIYYYLVKKKSASPIAVPFHAVDEQLIKDVEDALDITLGTELFSFLEQNHKKGALLGGQAKKDFIKLMKAIDQASYIDQDVKKFVNELNPASTIQAGFVMVLVGLVSCLLLF